MDIEGTFRDFADKRADKLLQTSARCATAAI